MNLSQISRSAPLLGDVRCGEARHRERPVSKPSVGVRGARSVALQATTSDAGRSGLDPLLFWVIAFNPH